VSDKPEGSGDRMKNAYRALVWEGRHVEQLGYYDFRASWRIGNGLPGGYDNYVSMRITEHEIEVYGPDVTCMRALLEMIDVVREVAYQALCSDSLMFDLAQWQRIANDARQRQYDAETKRDKIEADMAKVRELLGIVERES